MNEKGFTLLEAMVALVIFAFVTTVASSVFVQSYFNHVKNNQKIEVQENLRFALNRMARDIRQAAASSVKVYDAGGNLSLRGPKINFSLSSTREVVEYSYDSTGKEIEVKRSQAGSPQPLTDRIITGLEFQYDQDNKIVTVTAKGEKGASGEITLGTQIHLRVQ